MYPQKFHLESPQTPHGALPPFPPFPALKNTRPDPQSLTPTLSPAALQADGASAEPLEIHDGTERKTKKTRLRDSNGEHTLAPNQQREEPQY